ncbi:type I addiction module toxin, SymE family [Dickeya undicola]|uniref:Type I addiction module toxin, SymE family n=1 Tax=Dickeya undicola TaxID=1577887 RepID=A0ABX9WSE9_9GAMM|nr:type I addiction module toxin, SymE family [Dickeya undicola]
MFIKFKITTIHLNPLAELYISDNGELTLAGDWLTQSGLLTSPFSIEALPGRIMIRAESGAMLA